MNQWVAFFLGSPRRAMWTLGLVAFIICLISPSLFSIALNNFFGAILAVVGPLLPSILLLLIIIWGFRVMFKGLGGGGRGGRGNDRRHH